MTLDDTIYDWLSARHLSENLGKAKGETPLQALDKAVAALDAAIAEARQDAIAHLRKQCEIGAYK